jgi:cell division protease FtsH
MSTSPAQRAQTGSDPVSSPRPARDAVDVEVRRVTDECYDVARDQLSRHRAQLDSIAERLLEQESLDEAEVYALAGVPHSVAAATVPQAV